MKATRRSAMAASGAAALGLVGCTADGSETSSTPAAPGATSGETATTPAASRDPDHVALALAASMSAAQLAETREAGRRLDPGGRLAALHRTHLAALQEAAGASASPEPLPRPPGRVLTRARLRRHEIGVQRELAKLAEDAESGALARLFATMAAGIAAHVAALPRTEP